jgi:hypothetical protein
MNPYLSKLRVLIREKPLPEAASKPPKLGFEGFEGDHDTCFTGKDCTKGRGGHAIPTTGATTGGRFPDVYAAAYATLNARCPALVNELRWHEAKADADVFLSRWGAKALDLGWTAPDLFGLHPSAPLARYDCIGLVWMLRRRYVMALTETSAAIVAPDGNITTYRRQQS